MKRFVFKAQVVTRVMPPWGADPRFGDFRNVHRLTDAQIATISAWADSGAREGTGPAPVPPPTAESGWAHPSGRPPDLIVEMPYELNIPAQGQLPWFDIIQPWPFKEDKCVEAIQVLTSSGA